VIWTITQDTPLEPSSTTFEYNSDALTIFNQFVASFVHLSHSKNVRSIVDNMDTQIFYRQKRSTAKYLEEELGRRSAYSHSHSTREGGHETQGMAEQGVSVMTANQIKQMDDWDILVFHHNLPPFQARRMNWLEHPVLRDREAKAPPQLSSLPPLTPLTLRSPLTPAGTDDELTNPGDFE
jgi:type IV secretory pathway TraG/TraD family ATPase VirD4